MTAKGFLRATAWFAFGGIFLLGGALAYIVYVDRSADRNAREFCGMIAARSDISATKARAAAANISSGSTGSQFDFYFIHFFAFDRAVCEVSTDKAGKVVSVTVQMEID